MVKLRSHGSKLQNVTTWYRSAWGILIIENKTKTKPDALLTCLSKKRFRGIGKNEEITGCNAFFFLIVMILFWLFCLVFVGGAVGDVYSRDLNFVRRSSLSVLWKAGWRNDRALERNKRHFPFHYDDTIFSSSSSFPWYFFVCCCRCHTLPLSLHFPLAFLSRLSSEMSSRRKPANKQLKKKKIRIWFDRLVLLLPTAPAFSHPFLIYIKY